MTGRSHGSKTDVQTLARVEGDRTDVSVRRVETPKGERLELESGRGDIVRLDAVALECLAWQDRERFEGFFDPLEGDSRDAPPVVSIRDPATAANLTTITNEFAHVNVRKLAVSEREFLELVAPKVGVTVTLTAEGIERVTARSQAAFTELVRQRVE